MCLKVVIYIEYDGYSQIQRFNGLKEYITMYYYCNHIGFPFFIVSFFSLFSLSFILLSYNKLDNNNYQIYRF